MGLDEDTLDDEVQPGNSTDWLRLREICGLYCESEHSWEEVVHLLWEVEEWEIADRICGQERLLGEYTVHAKCYCLWGCSLGLIILYLTIEFQYKQA